MQAVVIGAGVVGLATARALARRGRTVLVLESEGRIGSGTSSRNSEVVHAGIYYPTGSLKATACVGGRRMLQSYCLERAVPFSRVGKMLVATSESDMQGLARIQHQAAQNGLTPPDEALQLLTVEEARALEPEVRCFGALLSPSTAIVDSHALMLALQVRMCQTYEMCLCVLCVCPLCDPPLRWWVLCGVLPSVWVPCGWGPPCRVPVSRGICSSSCLSLARTLPQ